MTSYDLIKRAPCRLYRKRDGIGQTPCSYERYFVFLNFFTLDAKNNSVSENLYGHIPSSALVCVLF